MTNEEAIKILRDTPIDIRSTREDDILTLYATAHNMAIDALQTDAVRCKDCKHQEHCHETVAHTRLHDGFKEHWSEPIEWCSRGERKGGEDE